MGKGDKYRVVDREKYDRGYDCIFNVKDPLQYVVVERGIPLGTFATVKQALDWMEPFGQRWLMLYRKSTATQLKRPILERTRIGQHVVEMFYNIHGETRCFRTRFAKRNET